jgi:hypothetical protein
MKIQVMREEDDQAGWVVIFFSKEGHRQKTPR